ncbi:hypothetical protein Rs2_50060 [Raphanus sativus]|uniref:Bifunctional protein FolD 4, chloroplastic-like n=1 Tax=Raphanus sativus TaxID=3726 RepID=A0A6J0KTV3_RAPSA|nr:bifunctional protein FolD 4, chloroplastic-like [Raphanus sativus]KAJ4868391.1 hypothetical protein Rs2_50060 [Raphanus sativus]
MEANIMRSLMGCTSFTPSVLIQKGAIIPRHLCLRTAVSARGSSSDAAMVIDKGKVAVDILHEIRTEVSRMKESIGMVPGLAVLHVGDTKLSKSYWVSCGFVGIRSFVVHLAEDTTEEKTLECVSSFNDDPCVHGILVELPLPTHMDEHKILNAVSIEKDIKGFHPLNIGLLAMRGREPFFLPQTPKACIELLHRNNIEIKGKRAVVIGRSNTFGMPAALLLQREDATVTIIHSKTKNPQDITRQADIIISAVGKPNMVRGSWIKPGAVIVDVGISYVRDRNARYGFRWVGDICYEEACEVASAIITDVGSEGLLESDMLLSNTLTSAKRLHNFL